MTTSRTAAQAAGTPDIDTALATSGIVSFGPRPAAATVAAWNGILDPHFEKEQAGRTHVGADVLTATGILGGCLDPGLRAVVAGTVPDARLYHAHAYEIAAATDRPHIHAGRLAGWHRDTETIHAYRPGRARHISLFVYLSDVHEDSGAFELLPWPPDGVRSGCLGAHRVTGAAGMTFAWNRSYYHRASPNRSSVRRRLLKLSWQSATLPNERIRLPELTDAAALAGQDEWLSVLLGGAGPHEALPPVGDAVPEVVDLAFNTSASFGRLDHLAERARVLRHRALAS